MPNTRDLISTAAVRALVGFICLLALGCGGGDGLDTTAVTSSSFSPFTATRPDGSPATTSFGLPLGADRHELGSGW